MDGGEWALAICMAMALVGAAVMYGGAAHAAQEGGAIPEWIKTVFGYYAAGQITDGELIGALQYLIGAGVITLPAAAGGAGGGASEPATAPSPAAMSEEARSLARQADVAECLADESRTMIAGWELDARASRGYTSDEYEQEMRDMITAGRASVQATEAWAAVARQAAADGSITAAERADISAADNDMAAADAAVYNALMSTAAGQLIGAFTDTSSGFFEGLLQASRIAGDETDCY